MLISGSIMSTLANRHLLITGDILSAVLHVVYWQISGYPTSVASLAFSPQGDLLAVASSYMHEFGQREAPPDAIFIRPVQDAEVKPKPRKNAPQ
jgi:hypothetical protein